MPSKYQIRRMRRHSNKYFHQYDTAKFPPGEKIIKSDEKIIRPGKSFLPLTFSVIVLLSSIILVLSYI